MKKKINISHTVGQIKKGFSLFRIIYGGWYCSSCERYHTRKKLKYINLIPNNDFSYLVTYTCTKERIINE